MIKQLAYCLNNEDFNLLGLEREENYSFCLEALRYCLKEATLHLFSLCALDSRHGKSDS